MSDRVLNQVEENALELLGIALGGPEALVELGPHRDAPGMGVGLPATQFANSVRPVLAMMTAPASRRFLVNVAS